MVINAQIYESRWTVHKTLSFWNKLSNLIVPDTVPQILLTNFPVYPVLYPSEIVSWDTLTSSSHTALALLSDIISRDTFKYLFEMSCNIHLVRCPARYSLKFLLCLGALSPETVCWGNITLPYGTYSNTALKTRSRETPSKSHGYVHLLFLNICYTVAR